MSYRHITPFERGKIEELNKLGYTCRAIAQNINRHHSSVARELRRAEHPKAYTAEQAHHDYKIKRKNSKPKGKCTPALVSLIKAKLTETWSPEQIANTATAAQLCFKTIYNWLYAGKLDGVTVSQLRRKGKKRSCRNLAFFARGTPIRKRPKEVYDRKTFGHWELDTVVSSKGTHGCFATFIERKTRFYTAVKMIDRTTESMERAINHVFHALPAKAFITATTDRGGEFACFEAIKRDLGVTLYFADPYCPHQRGSNEYGNGLLREFFPKGIDLGTVDDISLRHALDLINNRPRKCLNWISSANAFLLEIGALGVAI
jgi:IS30 family transposase